MDCIKRSMMPVRYKKIGSGETYLLLEALFFTSAEPVDKKRKKQAGEAWGMRHGRGINRPPPVDAPLVRL